MSWIALYRQNYDLKHLELCIGNISKRTEQSALINYFRKFGTVIHTSFTSSTGGYVFVTYGEPYMVDNCMNNRPHYLDGQHLYVKRALPIDEEHPRERFETTRDLMIVIDFDTKNFQDKEFLLKLRDYFSSYGRTYNCKYCHEKYFDYILLEFGDKDAVDRIILDKPHCYNEHELDVMKYIPSNIDIQNQKYSKKNPHRSIPTDAIDDENYDSIKSQNKPSGSKEPISEVDLENEVYRLQDVYKQINEEFAIKRKQLENDCCEQLKELNDDSEKAQQLQQDLEKEHARLLAKIQSLKRENEELNEQYLAAELENFEITSYYEQILAEEKAHTVQLEAEHAEKLKTLNANSSSPHSTDSSTSSKSPLELTTLNNN